MPSNLRLIKTAKKNITRKKKNNERKKKRTIMKKYRERKNISLVCITFQIYSDSIYRKPKNISNHHTSSSIWGKSKSFKVVTPYYLF